MNSQSFLTNIFVKTTSFIRIGIVAFFILLQFNALSQTGNVHSRQRMNNTLIDELQAFSDLSLLPVYNGISSEQQFSSYDGSGGNDDGFSGKYSFIRRNPDSSLTMAEVYGAGCINRIATPTPTDDTLDIFIDDSLRPRMSVCYMDLFSGRIEPFSHPLCGQGAGGYYCYFPILFQKFCRIVCRGKKLQFHQIQYRLYPGGTLVEPFKPQLSRKERVALTKINKLWKGRKLANHAFKQATKAIEKDFDLSQANTETLAEFTKGARISGIEISPASVFTDSAKDIWLEITQDGETVPCLSVPVADFFGFALGKPSMKSVIIGSEKNICYCYFPMPFDKTMDVRLVYKGKGTPVHLKTRICYQPQKHDSTIEGRFYVSYENHDITSDDAWHVLLDRKGRGHYVGTILWAQGRQPGRFLFFEGDDSTATDGVFRIHGTGSEDYFNGGWYSMPGRWDSARSFPLSGCLLFDQTNTMTGGYRFYLSDKIPFGHSIWMGLEHGESAGLPVPAHYRSVAFYYADRPSTQ